MLCSYSFFVSPHEIPSAIISIYFFFKYDDVRLEKVKMINVFRLNQFSEQFRCVVSRKNVLDIDIDKISSQFQFFKIECKFNNIQ